MPSSNKLPQKGFRLSRQRAIPAKPAAMGKFHLIPQLVALPSTQQPPLPMMSQLAARNSLKMVSKAIIGKPTIVPTCRVQLVIFLKQYGTTLAILQLIRTDASAAALNTY